MEHTTHGDHTHLHEPSCSHPAVKHDDHVDYLHDGHLHSLHDGHIDEHVISVTDENPAVCAPHECGGHESAHTHTPGCGHEAVPHADHVDYLVSGHLHFAHGSHCDDHGALVTA